MCFPGPGTILPLRKCNSWLIGAVQPNHSGDPVRQVDRWTRFVRQWIKAAHTSDCTVIGDVNLDKMKWLHPDHLHLQMIDQVKSEIETRGFFQLVQGTTRSWPGVPDSLVDHIWSNAPDRCNSVRNIVRAQSDHNFVETKIRLKGRIYNPQVQVRRLWSRFNPVSFRDQLDQVNWDTLYSIQNLDLANTFFETTVQEALNSQAPLKTLIPNKKIKSWVGPDTRKLMEDRNTAREKAKTTQDLTDWESYRHLRNSCNTKIKKDKIFHFEKIYSKCQTTNDTKLLHSTFKNQLGWNVSGPPSAFLS